MEFTTTIAKTLFQYNVNDAIGIETALTNSVNPAKLQFKGLLGEPEYKRFANNTSSLTATSKYQVNEKSTVFYKQDHILKVGDSVTLDNKIFSIIMIEEDYFTIDDVYSGSELAFTINTLNDYSYIFAYCVLYQLTYTARQIELNTILSQSQQYGDGQILPAFGSSVKSNPIDDYRNSLIKNINSLLEPYSVLRPQEKSQFGIIR